MSITSTSPSKAGTSAKQAATRRRTRKSEPSSRDLLLRAARKEFATKGLEGARVDEIAARAGVNKQLVYHHFSNKESLYQAVLEQAYARIRAEEAKLDLSSGDPGEAMARLVSFSFDYLAANRDFVALLSDENFHRGRHLKGAATLRQMHSPLIALIAQTLKRGADAGLFRADVDPVQLYISIAGLGFFYFSNVHTLSSIFDTNFNGKEQIARRRIHVVDFVLSALRPD